MDYGNGGSIFVLHRIDGVDLAGGAMPYVKGTPIFCIGGNWGHP